MNIKINYQKSDAFYLPKLRGKINIMVSVRRRGKVYQYQFDGAPIDGKNKIRILNST